MTEQQKNMALEQFHAVVDSSCLPVKDKQKLKNMAARTGMTDELWKRFDDLLVALIEERALIKDQHKAELDAEVARYTAEYESEKKIIDNKMRDDLAALGEADESIRTALWGAYYSKLQQLQDRLLENIRHTSQTTLQGMASVIKANRTMT